MFNVVSLSCGIAYRRQFYADLQNLYPVPYVSTAKISGKGFNIGRFAQDTETEQNPEVVKECYLRCSETWPWVSFEGWRQPCPKHNIPQVSNSLQRAFPDNQVGLQFFARGNPWEERRMLHSHLELVWLPDWIPMQGEILSQKNKIEWLIRPSTFLWFPHIYRGHFSTYKHVHNFHTYYISTSQYTPCIAICL